MKLSALSIGNPALLLKISSLSTGMSVQLHRMSPKHKNVSLDKKEPSTLAISG